MLVQRVDPFTGEENEVELPVTQHDLLRLDLGEDPDLVLVRLRPWQRDFVVTGVFSPPWLEPSPLPVYTAKEIQREYLGDFTLAQNK